MFCFAAAYDPVIILLAKLCYEMLDDCTAAIELINLLTKLTDEIHVFTFRTVLLSTTDSYFLIGWSRAVVVAVLSGERRSVFASWKRAESTAMTTTLTTTT